MFKESAFKKTPSTSDYWKSLSADQKIDLIKEELETNTKLKDFEVYNALDDGQIIFKVQKTIPSNERGIILLDFEEQLKKKIDEGLTVWLLPVGDKSKLRNLRGIQFQSE